MQLVKTERDNLLRLLHIVTGIVERRHTLPILTHLRMTKQGEQLALLATDLEVQITTNGKFGLGETEVATTVAARMLLDILRAMPAGEVILSLKDQRLVVQSGVKKSRFTLPTLAAEDFPTLALTQDLLSSFTLSQRDFRNLLGQTHFAMAQQDIRYYLNGLLLVLEGSQLSAVATDGHRLAWASSTLESAPKGDVTRQELIVPRKTVLELQRLLEDVEDPLHIDISPTQVKFTFGDVELVSKRVEGKFPDFQRVIPTGYTNTFSVQREDLLQTLQRAAILTSNKFRGVRCVIEPGQLSIAFSSPDQEEVQEDLSIDYQGASLSMGVNIAYVLDVLTNLKVDTLQMSLGDSNSSILFTLEGQEFKYVVMPMRL